MTIEFANQCCDAHAYLYIGKTCADGVQCWHPLRPVGSALYFSLPYRLGLPPEILIGLNAVCILASVACGFAAMRALLPKASRARQATLMVCVLVAHVFFMERVIFTSLSDVPAAAAAMLSIWLLILAASRHRPWLSGGAGLALGVAVSMRAYYLYPALIAAGCFLLLASLRKARVSLTAVFCLTLALPIALQFMATHAHTGAWSFIEEQATATGMQIHFENITYGYDTRFVDQHASPIHYNADSCFDESKGMGDAVRRAKWSDFACLMAHRQWFYFGSFVPRGEAYLTDAAQRHFSASFFACNVLALLVAVAWLFRQVRRVWPLAVGVVLFGAIWAEGSLIVPESRFLMVVHVVLWVFAAAGVHEFLPELYKRWNLPRLRSLVRLPVRSSKS